MKGFRELLILIRDLAIGIVASLGFLITGILIVLSNKLKKLLGVAVFLVAFSSWNAWGSEGMVTLSPKPFPEYMIIFLFGLLFTILFKKRFAKKKVN